MNAAMHQHALHLQAETKAEQRILVHIFDEMELTTWTRRVDVDGLDPELAGEGYEPGMQALVVRRSLNWDYFRGVTQGAKNEAAMRAARTA